jgi:hypothetical protein
VAVTVPGLGERKARLTRIASELEEPPEVLAYWAVPPSRGLAGPGWYMGPSYQDLTYLGYSSAAAEVRLIELLRAEEKAGAA